MSPTTVLRRAKKRLESLSEERLRVADDFLAYLEEREASEATAELLRIPNFIRDLQRGEQEAQAGLLTPVEKLARKS